MNGSRKDAVSLLIGRQQCILPFDKESCPTFLAAVVGWRADDCFALKVVDGCL